MSEERRRVGLFERRLQTFVITIALGVVSWVGYQTLETTVKLEGFTATFSGKIDLLNEKIGNYIDRDDLKHNQIDQRCKVVEDRITNIASRVRHLEERVLAYEFNCEATEPNAKYEPQAGGQDGRLLSQSRRDGG